MSKIWENAAQKKWHRYTGFVKRFSAVRRQLQTYLDATIPQEKYVGRILIEIPLLPEQLRSILPPTETQYYDFVYHDGPVPASHNTRDAAYALSHLRRRLWFYCGGQIAKGFDQRYAAKIGVHRRRKRPTSPVAHPRMQLWVPRSFAKKHGLTIVKYTPQK